MRRLELRTERLADLDPEDLVRVAGAEATRDGKCRSLFPECYTGVRCALSYDACLAADRG